MQKTKEKLKLFGEEAKIGIIAILITSILVYLEVHYFINI